MKFAAVIGETVWGVGETAEAAEREAREVVSENHGEGVDLGALRAVAITAEDYERIVGGDPRLTT